MGRFFPNLSVAWAVVAFLVPISLFITALHLYRRLIRERRKTSAARVSGLDPPLGTRDPALLWPSVLSTPPAAAGGEEGNGGAQQRSASITITRPASAKGGHQLAGGAHGGDKSAGAPGSGRSKRGGAPPPEQPRGERGQDTAGGGRGARDQACQCVGNDAV